jgi:serine/threonine protein kinase
VSHPNAVAILDSGVSSQGIAYLVMELLNGPTLFAELWRVRQMSLPRCLEIIVPLCDVLSAAHAAGIVHRDIKPENILLHQGPSGEVVKVLDFGIAKLLDSDPQSVTPVVTSNDAFLGTPQYMAPERLEGGEYDGRSDVFSTAILLHEMLSGRPPFDDRNQPAMRVMFNHLHGTPAPLRAHAPQYPASLEALLLRALSRAKEQRPTAQELRDELIRIAQESPGLQDPAPQDRDEPSKHRRPEILSERTAAAVAQNWLSDDSQVALKIEQEPGAHAPVPDMLDADGQDDPSNMNRAETVPPRRR